MGLIEELYLEVYTSITYLEGYIVSVSLNISAKICVVQLYQNWKIVEVSFNLCVVDYDVLLIGEHVDGVFSKRYLIFYKQPRQLVSTETCAVSTLYAHSVSIASRMHVIQHHNDMTRLSPIRV